MDFGVTVATTTNRGHPPEFYVERICQRLLYISDNAAPEIKAQAIAYQDQMKNTVLEGIRRAILSDRTTVIGELRRAGMDEAAKLVHAMRS